MKNYQAFRTLNTISFQPQDTLVIFGEVFDRGYVNGLIEAANQQGIQIVYSTVGRGMQPLTAEQINEKGPQQKNLINIPLEAGFDMTPLSEDPTQTDSIVDQLKSVKLSDWENLQLDPQSWQEAKLRSRNDFQRRCQAWVAELTQKFELKGNVIFAHTMAGGVPRAKIIMPIMNRVFKGRGDRYVPSKDFLEHGLGKLCLENFNEVTARTFLTLIETTEQLRSKIQSRGNKVAYLAYGYHGTEVLQNGEFKWQTYTPYVQGIAKMLLEDYARQASSQGITAMVANCPEILTNSSSIFQGVEVSLYPLIEALRLNSPKWHEIKNQLVQKLKPEGSLELIKTMTEEYLAHPTIGALQDFERWPLNNTAEHMELMLNASQNLRELHHSNDQLITEDLSEIVFKACGKIMLHSVWNPPSPVMWINHDIIAKIHD